MGILWRITGLAEASSNYGRHRVKVARDLGWPGIPAEAIEVARKLT